MGTYATSVLAASIRRGGRQKATSILAASIRRSRKRQPSRHCVVRDPIEASEKVVRRSMSGDRRAEQASSLQNDVTSAFFVRHQIKGYTITVSEERNVSLRNVELRPFIVGSMFVDIALFEASEGQLKLAMTIRRVGSPDVVVVRQTTETFSNLKLETDEKDCRVTGTIVEESVHSIDSCVLV